MELMGLAEAGQELGVSARRVHQLVASGRLQGRRIGRSWVLERVEVERLARRRPHAGRPWKPASAWGVLALASGEQLRASAVDRSRAMQRLQHGLEPLAGRLSSRARDCWFYAHPAVLADVAAHSETVASGVSALSAHDVDLVAGDQAEAYVRESGLADVVGRFALDPDSDRPNVRLRVVDDDDWPFDADRRVAPAPVVAVDLLDSDDERSRRAARELLARA